MKDGRLIRRERGGEAFHRGKEDLIALGEWSSTRILCLRGGEIARSCDVRQEKDGTDES